MHEMPLFSMLNLLNFTLNLVYEIKGKKATDIKNLIKFH